MRNNRLGRRERNNRLGGGVSETILDDDSGARMGFFSFFCHLPSLLHPSRVPSSPIPVPSPFSNLRRHLGTTKAVACQVVAVWNDGAGAGVFHRPVGRLMVALAVSFRFKNDSSPALLLNYWHAIGSEIRIW